MSASGGKLALFDFDGTITRTDTLFEVIKFTCGKCRYYLGIISLTPYFILYFIHVIPNWRMKEIVLRKFFGGLPVELFESRCKEFTKVILPKIIRPKALDILKKLKENQTEIMVVTASAENWVAPWCQELGIGCIATRLEIKDNFLTGKIKGRNCNGIEKVNRLKEVIDLSKYGEIEAFGDSKGDLPMLKLATQAYYKPFRD